MALTLADAQSTAIRVGEGFAAIFTSPTSNFSAISLLSALTIASIFLAARRGWARPVRPAAMLRALLPRRWWRSASTRADFGFLLFNTFIAGFMIGWAILSFATVRGVVGGVLSTFPGEFVKFEVSRQALAAIYTVGAYIAYEAGYYADHWLKHRVPFLWQFHRIHHSAEILTPLTNARMHPVDSAIFANIIAVALGTASAVLGHLFEAPGPAMSVEGTNVILLAALFLVLHLQHSHVWIPFTGWLGRLLLSPAHHQLHHSTNPAHFNRNFGATLAVFDWFCGTLLIPEKTPQRLTFGAGPYAYDPHSPSGALIMPFVEAARELPLRAEDVRVARPLTR